MQTGSNAYGGAIYNKGTIEDITGDFTDNYAQGRTAEGGAIYNYGTYSTIGDISGDFTDNYAESDSVSASGGAIYNYQGTIGDINGDFSNNYAQGYYAYGGAIYNKGTIGDITGDFSGNYAKSGSFYADGGAIYNYQGTIGDIIGNFENNYAQADSDFAYGGAIYNNYGSIGDISGDFSNNHAQSGSGYAQGGAIYNSGSKATIGDITGDFTNNYAQSETGSAEGGAIYNSGTITLTNSSFYDNYVETGAAKDSEKGQKTLGGAIYSTKDLTIKADDGESIFRGNKIKWANGEEESSAIYLAGTSGNKLYLDAQNNGLIEFDDKISAAKLSTIVITGDKTGNITFNNVLENFAPLDVQQTNVNIKEGAETVVNTTVHDDGTLNILENATAEDSVVNDKGTLLPMTVQT